MKIIRRQRQEEQEEKPQEEKTTKKENDCLRCGYNWNGLVKQPKICPRCKSYVWKTPRIRSIEN